MINNAACAYVILESLLKRPPVWLARRFEFALLYIPHSATLEQQQLMNVTHTLSQWAARVLTLCGCVGVCCVLRAAVCVVVRFPLLLLVVL